MSIGNRSPNDVLQEFSEVPYEHPGAIAATTTWKLRTIQRPCRIDKVEYDNPTGYTADPANYYTLELRKNAVVIASWSCLTGAQGTIAADVFVNLVLSATDANRVCAVGDVLTLAAVKTGAAANLPLGRIVAHCRYV